MDTISYRNAVADEMLALMGRRRLTRAAVYRATEMSAMYFTRRINGELPFTIDDLLKIAAVLDVPVTALLPSPAGDPDGAAGSPATHRYAQPVELVDQPTALAA